MKRTLHEENKRPDTNEAMSCMAQKVAAIMELDHRKGGFVYQQDNYEQIAMKKFDSDTAALQERAMAGFYNPRNDISNHWRTDRHQSGSDGVFN